MRCLLCVTALLVLASTLVRGQDPKFDDSFDSTDPYEQRLLDLEREVQRLRSVSPAATANLDASLDEHAELVRPAGYVAPRMSNDSHIHTADGAGPGGFTLYSPQPTAGAPAAARPAVTYPTVRVTGFFQLDNAIFNQDELNRATVGDVENGLGFRRARLAATGNVTDNVGYMYEIDIAQGQARFVDMWMEMKDIPLLGNIRVGRYRQPFGMEEMTSVRELAFAERSLLFALSPFRQTGIMSYNHNAAETATWALSAYRYLSDNFGNVYGDDGGWGFAGRVTLLPIYDDDGDCLLHIGADYSFNDPARELVQYASQPEIFVSQNPVIGPGGLDNLPIVSVPPFVQTGMIPTSYTNLFDLEAAAALGRFYLQSEARWAVLKHLDGSTIVFPGAMLQARYVLTGEKLPYNRQGGVFGRITPDHPVKFGAGAGLGAWEIAGRWSYLDLNEPGDPGPGRTLNDVTAGINWYLNKFTRFQFSYIHAFLTDPTLGRSNADIFDIRGQIDF
jgi:phosphate-selective porin OprO/OprP